MAQIDTDYCKQRIKDSLKYFSEDGLTIDSDTFLRVLKRAHNHKEDQLKDHINKNAKDGLLDYDGVMAVNELLRAK